MASVAISASKPPWTWTFFWQVPTLAHLAHLVRANFSRVSNIPWFHDDSMMIPWCFPHTKLGHGISWNITTCFCRSALCFPKVQFSNVMMCKLRARMHMDWQQLPGYLPRSPCWFPILKDVGISASTLHRLGHWEFTRIQSCWSDDKWWQVMTSDDLQVLSFDMFGDCEIVRIVPICALGIRASTYPFRDWRVGAVGLLRVHRRATGVGPGLRICGLCVAHGSVHSGGPAAEWPWPPVPVEARLGFGAEMCRVASESTTMSWLQLTLQDNHRDYACRSFETKQTYSASFCIFSVCREHRCGGSWKVVHWLLVMCHSSWDPWTKLKRKAGSWWNVSIPKAEIEKHQSYGKNRPGRHQSYGALWFPFGWRVDGITTRKAKPCQDVAWKADLHLLYTAFCRMYFHVQQIVLVDWCWLIFVGVHKFKAWLSLATSGLLLGRPGPTWDCF